MPLICPECGGTDIEVHHTTAECLECGYTARLVRFRLQLIKPDFVAGAEDEEIGLRSVA